MLIQFIHLCTLLQPIQKQIYSSSSEFAASYLSRDSKPISL